MVKKHFKTFEKMSAPVYIPTNSAQGFPFLHQYHPHRHLVISCVFDDSHPNRYKVISHCACYF